MWCVGRNVFNKPMVETIKSLARTFVSMLFVAPAFAFSAIAADMPTGQWSGNSQVDGDHTVAKTILSLGTADAEDGTLRIDGRSTCTLKQGKFASADAGAWTLSFKDTSDGDACPRLAKGTFTLRQGATPRQRDFEVKYPGSDGQYVLRRGALTRYP